MNKKMTSNKKRKEIVDAQFHHPFTCMVVGPTQSGKSTWVRNLLLNADRMIDKKFDYIFIFMGTPRNQNTTLWELEKLLPSTEVNIFELNDLYVNKNELKKDFPKHLEEQLEKRIGLNQNGCIIFDDLMRELSECNVLFDMFTKFSSHYNVSCIFISQNPFHTGSNKTTSTTLFRNTHIFVIFKCALDNIPLRIIATRMAQPQAPFMAMVKHVQNMYRYIVIRGDQNTPASLIFTSDIFGSHMKSFEIMN